MQSSEPEWPFMCLALVVVFILLVAAFQPFWRYF